MRGAKGIKKLPPVTTGATAKSDGGSASSLFQKRPVNSWPWGCSSNSMSPWASLEASEQARGPKRTDVAEPRVRILPLAEETFVAFSFRTAAKTDPGHGDSAFTLAFSRRCDAQVAVHGLIRPSSLLRQLQGFGKCAV